MSNHSVLFRLLRSAWLAARIGSGKSGCDRYLPRPTVLVVFTHTVNAAKAKAGDVVTAKTMQVVVLPDGDQLPKGTMVTGHIVEVRPFQVRRDSICCPAGLVPLHPDRPCGEGRHSAVATSVRALADAIPTEEALTPHGSMSPILPGTVTLIGGAHYSPVDKHVTAWTGRRCRGLQQEAGSLCASASRRCG